MKEPIFNILVPVDFTPGSLHAADCAVSLSRKLAVNILLLHVYKVPQIATEVPINFEAESRQMRVKAEEEMTALVERIRAASGSVECSGLVVTGDVDDRINETVEGKQVDLIILGSHPTTPLQALLFGSVTGDMIKYSKCPVLVVPEKAELSGIKKIVYATNMFGAEVDAIMDLTGMARLFDATITVVHVHTPKESNSAKLFHDFRHQVNTSVSYPELQFKQIQGEHVQDTLEKYLDEARVGMLAMLNIQRGPIEYLLNPSMTRKLSYHLHIPLLVFHHTVEKVKV